MDAGAIIVAAAALVTSLATLAGTIGGILITLRTSAKLDATAAKVEIVHKATNSMKDALVKATGEKEHAKGVIEGEKKKKATVRAKPKKGS